MQKHRFVSVLCGVALSVVCLSTAYAQQRWSVGPRIGANFSRIVGPDVPENRFVPGFTGGLYVMYSDVNHFGISADVLFSQQGARFATGNVTYTQRLNYLSVPVAARYFMNLRGKFRPNLFVGGAANFLLNSRVRNYTVNGQEQPEQTNTSSFNGVDIAWLAGLGLNFKVTKARWVQTDIRYQQSLAPIQSVANAPDQRNATLSVVFSYAFGVGKKYKR
jgi:hypothetical protein